MRRIELLVVALAAGWVGAVEDSIQLGDSELASAITSASTSHTFKYQSYTDYVNAQRSKTDRIAAEQKESGKLKWNSAVESVFLAMANYINATLPLTSKFALCHGTRGGREQKLLRKLLPGMEVMTLNRDPLVPFFPPRAEFLSALLSLLQVMGTELSAEMAALAPYTLNWDFHKVKPEWEQRVDFVYSNALDHSFDARYAISQWMKEVSFDGALFIEWTAEQMRVGQERSMRGGVHRGNKVDPFQASSDQLQSVFANASSLATSEGRRGFFINTTFSSAGRTIYVVQHEQEVIQQQHEGGKGQGRRRGPK